MGPDGLLPFRRGSLREACVLGVIGRRDIIDVMRTKTLAVAAIASKAQDGVEQLNKAMTEFMLNLVPDLRRQRDTFSAHAREVVDALKDYVILARPLGPDSNMLSKARAKSLRRQKPKR